MPDAIRNLVFCEPEGLQGSGWRTVPAHDPVIQEAAQHAVKNIQQKSNSLASYELQEVLLAKAEVIEESAKFDLLLKIKRGGKEEKHKVEMQQGHDGRWIMNHAKHDTVV